MAHRLRSWHDIAAMRHRYRNLLAQVSDLVLFVRDMFWYYAHSTNFAPPLIPNVRKRVWEPQLSQTQTFNTHQGVRRSHNYPATLPQLGTHLRFQDLAARIEQKGARWRQTIITYWCAEHCLQPLLPEGSIVHRVVPRTSNQHFYRTNITEHVKANKQQKQQNIYIYVYILRCTQRVSASGLCKGVCAGGYAVGVVQDRIGLCGGLCEPTLAQRICFFVFY